MKNISLVVSDVDGTLVDGDKKLRPATVDAVARVRAAGIGFTVSLLIGDLAYGAGTEADDHVKVGILAGSLLAALLAGVLVRSRDKVYRRVAAAEAVDEDHDGVPDVYQSPETSAADSGTTVHGEGRA